MIAARQKIFGIENVDANTGAVRKDKIVFSWLGHISGAVSFMGRVIMMDTYVPRLEVTPGRTPYVIQDLVDLKPEAAFISHGHGDHADNAAFIAAKTGAKLYMSPEACGTAQIALARMKADPFMQADPLFAIPPSTTISCTGITTPGSTPGTQVVQDHTARAALSASTGSARCIRRRSRSIRIGATVVVVDTPDPRDPTLFPVGVSLTPPITPRNRQPGQQDLRQGDGSRRPGSDRLSVRRALRIQLHDPVQQLGRCDEGGHRKQLAERRAGRRQAAARPHAGDAQYGPELRHAVVGQHRPQRLA